MGLLAFIATAGMAAFLWWLIAPGRAGGCGSVASRRVDLHAGHGLVCRAVGGLLRAPAGGAIGRGNSCVICFRKYHLDFWNLRWEWRQAPITILGLLLSFSTAVLVILTPISVPILTAQAWWQRANSLVGQVRLPNAALAMATPLLLWGGLLVFTMHQPQRQVFSLLSKPPTSPAEAQNLLDRRIQVRSGLLNSYLAPSATSRR